MKKQILTAVITAFILMFAGISYSCSYNNEKTPTNQIQSLTQEDDTDEKDVNTEEVQNEIENEKDDIIDHMIYVHICGAVVNENVYQVKYGTRLIEVINLAGGLLENAAGDFVNQAVMVEDGQRIYIPTIDEIIDIETMEYIKGDQSSVSDNDRGTNALININTATMDDLMKLPGIGKAKAEKIIEFRSNNGDFNNIEELMNISGIKEGLFNQISSYITVK